MSQTMSAEKPQPTRTEQTGGAATTSKLSVRSVLPSQIGEIWEDIAPMVRRALEHAQGETTTLEDTYAAMRLGWIGTWLIVNEKNEIIGVVGHENQKNPGNRVLFVNFVAGRDFDKWSARLQEYLIAHKKQIGADVIWSSSRAGMMKKLKKLGWRVKAYIMEAPDG